jgi:regulator of protease activity HflC (stomatin/prohibitin superfamily)
VTSPCIDVDNGGPLGAALLILLIVAGGATLAGLYMLQPSEAAILTLFGAYRGTDRSEGLRWANPFYSRRRISLRARNLNMTTLKVNDRRGNPVEISAAVVWRVRDTAQAVFEVDDYELFVKVQAETALRHLASIYNYDEGEDADQREITLRGGLEEVALALKTELQARLADERKAAMISNLLVVQCSDKDTQPIVNTGTPCA